VKGNLKGASEHNLDISSEATMKEKVKVRRALLQIKGLGRV
jgi:gamma-glutamylcysteine synthetase